MVICYFYILCISKKENKLGPLQKKTRYIKNHLTQKLKKYQDNLSLKQIKDKIILLAKYLFDPNTSKAHKMMVASVLIYFISPIDAISDFLPFVGLSDDIALIVWVYNKLLPDLDDYNKKSQK